MFMMILTWVKCCGPPAIYWLLWLASLGFCFMAWWLIVRLMLSHPSKEDIVETVRRVRIKV